MVKLPKSQLIKIIIKIQRKSFSRKENIDQNVVNHIKTKKKD